MEINQALRRLLIYLKYLLQLFCFARLYFNNQIFRDSSMVEQLTVNQLVAGSNPARGAR